MSDPLVEPPDMRTLLAPVGVDKFFAVYWQRCVLALNIGQDVLGEIMEEIGTLDVVRFAGLAQGGVQAWVASEQVTHSVLSVDASSAAKALTMGATLYFIDVPLERLKRSLAELLGTRQNRIMTSFFLTPPGGGATWHFDANENFTIQLTGSKRWAVAGVPTIPAAPDGYVVGLRVPASLQGLLGEINLDPARKVDMRPGSLLYVPRGMLHQTEAHEESWSLNLSYVRTMWLDLVCDGLRHRMATSERWRSTVSGIGDKCDPFARTANILPDLIEELRAILAEADEMKWLRQNFLDPSV